MESSEAVAAYVRAGKPNGILSGMYAFQIEQVSKMVRPGDRVLDLGCGPGSLLHSIATMNQDADFLGIDLSSEMIASGVVSRGTVEALDNLELRVDDMTTLETIESGSIDVVISSMAMHHLPSQHSLSDCFSAIERVLTPSGRIFISDFGRMRSLHSIEYFVRRAIPADEPVLEADYRASLRAAFSMAEIQSSLSDQLRNRVGIFSTIVSPVMIVLMTPFPVQQFTTERRSAGRNRLPLKRLVDLWQLRLFLRLGGMPVR